MSYETASHHVPLQSIANMLLVSIMHAYQVAHMELDKVSGAAADGKRRGDVRHADMRVDIEQPSAKADGEPPGGA